MSKFIEALDNPKIPYLIGETAYIFEGDFDYLTKLTKEIIKKKSCDAIKFHILIDIDTYMTPTHKLYPMIKKFLLPEYEWVEILKLTKSKGFETVILIDDMASIDFIENNKDLVDAMEIHAFALNHVEMLDRIKKIKIPIILGVGGSEIEDIEYAVDHLGRKDVMLMHGFQNYPTKYEYINFKKMLNLKEKFGLPIGYADHTSWDNELNQEVTLAGFMSGANFIEKHVAFEAGKERCDFNSAIGVDQLAEIRRKIEILNMTKGDGGFEINDYESAYAKNGPMKFTIVASKEIKKDEEITEDNITYMRTDKENNIRQSEYLDLLGKKASKDISRYDPVNWRNVKR